MTQWPAWTPEEEADLLSGMDYDTFRRKHPTNPTRPNHVLRNKRNRLKRRDRRQHVTRIRGVNDPAPELPFSVNIQDWVRSITPDPDDNADYNALYPEPEPAIIGATARVDTDIEAIRRAAEQKFEAKQRRAILKQHQRVRFDHGPIALFFVGDQHIGNTGTNVARMFAEQDMILATPASYVVLMGDTVDNYIVGKLMAENMNAALNVWEQWELAKHYVHRWGKRIIGQNSGNHSQWATKMAGIDYDRAITPDGVLYDADELRFTVHVGPHEVKVRTRHKWRGNSQYNASHALERAAKFDTPDYDVFVGAHVHQGATAREFIHNGRRKLALMSSTYKEIDGYQRQEGFTENDASTAVALVVNDDGSFFGTSNLQSVLHYMKRVYRG